KKEFSDLAEPHVLEGDIQIMRGQYNDAIAAYDKAGELLSNETITVKRFQARDRAGRADSYQVLQDWLVAHPESISVRIALAQAHQTGGRTDDAVAEYRRVLEQAPDDVVSLNNLAWLYAEMGGVENLKTGTEIAARAHRQLPDLGQITDTYGWLMLLQGNVDEAISTLRQAARQSPDDPDIRYHLAVALHRRGASSEARDLLDAILADGSGFSSRDEARALREEL
ncbi:MAG: tetratricopeptide repeat protein, partial [Gammaproteobacteria bacterium]|nr:tetratricopeptide repeat protein [Gammaproteobacteria bacterium]